MRGHEVNEHQHGVPLPVYDWGERWYVGLSAIHCCTGILGQMVLGNCPAGSAEGLDHERKQNAE